MLNHTRRRRRPRVRRCRCAASTTRRTTASIPAMRARYVDDAGYRQHVGARAPRPLRLALDVLRHYAAHAGVDGFRLDLAITLARRDGGFDPDAPLLQARSRRIRCCARCKFDRRAWDIGPRRLSTRRVSGRLGRMERPLSRRRAAVLARRAALTSDELATRLAGSADVFRSRRAAVVLDQLRHRARWLHARRPRRPREQAQRGERRRQSRRHRRRIGPWNHGVEGASRRSRK